MEDLKDLKVGDKVWTIRDGWNVVKNIDKGIVDYPILVGIELYTIDGKIDILDKNPSLFLTNPFEQQGKEMLVKNEHFDWCIRDAIVTNNGIYVKSQWKIAKEITEPTQVELTLEQIAEKFGCDVNQLKIKK